MKVIRMITTFCLIIGLLLSFVSSTAIAAVSAQPERVWVSYEGGKHDEVLKYLIEIKATIHYDFPELEAIVVTLPVSQVNSISSNTSITSIETDPERYPVEPIRVEQDFSQLEGIINAEQVVPYGIDMVGARRVWDSNHDGVIDPGAFTGAGKTVCIIDTGYYEDHEDLPEAIDGYSQVDTNWARDGYGHGTHVAGTIAAKNDGVGVVGVTPGTASLYIIKIFDDNGKFVVWASDLVDALSRCRNAGAKIVSMSLGGDEWSDSEENAFAEAYADGVLSIAAAGNSGTTEFAYPASYDSVISVGAIDSSMAWANFSQYNNQVELAAPGVGVLSTIPYIDTNTLAVAGTTYQAYHIENSAYGTATGTLVNGGLCDSSNTDWTGKIVLCERGVQDFYTKVNNVRLGGGLAAVIYNNIPGYFLATLGDGNTSTIVAQSISQALGQYLLANRLDYATTITSINQKPASGYAAWSGTSMATPHVAGVAALVWSCEPTATNVQVRNALTTTALDLGTTGRDDYYGFGLVRTLEACVNLNPTSVDLLYFKPQVVPGGVLLTWETANEINTLGFNLYRSSSLDGKQIQLNSELIQSKNPPGSTSGATYSYFDPDVLSGVTYHYQLEDVSLDQMTINGIYDASIKPGWIYLPSITR